VSQFLRILFLLPLLGEFGCQPVIKKADEVRQKIVCLKKANGDLVSFCRWGDVHITYPPQLSCPWCGCVWLFACIACRKAFTFAQGVESGTSWGNWLVGTLAIAIASLSPMPKSHTGLTP
jgi:hypothetical protein